MLRTPCIITDFHRQLEYGIDVYSVLLQMMSALHSTHGYEFMTLLIVSVIHHYCHPPYHTQPSQVCMYLCMHPAVSDHRQTVGCSSEIVVKSISFLLSQSAYLSYLQNAVETGEPVCIPSVWLTTVHCFHFSPSVFCNSLILAGICRRMALPQATLYQ